jgi:hypothetical protein
MQFKIANESNIRERLFMKPRYFAYCLLGISMIATLTPASAVAAYTVKPKVGQCFMLSLDDVAAAHAGKNPIKCTKTHNAETYIVAKWPLTTPAEELPEGEGLEIATSLCKASGSNGILAGTYFTYWAWYTPDPGAWARGERWLRCDGMRTLDTEGPYNFISWKGQKFKAKKNL